MSINSTRPGGTVGGLTPTGQEVVTNKDIDGGTASNTSRHTVPKGTATALAALTRKEGTTVYDTDAKGLYIDNGTDLVAVGSGTTARNYMGDNFDGNKDPGVLSLTGGTGNITVSNLTSAFYAATGQPTSALVKSTSILLRRSFNYLTAVTSFDATGVTVWDQFPAFTLDGVDLGKPASISFDTTGNTIDGQWDAVIAHYNSSGTFIELISIAGNASGATVPSAKIPMGTVNFQGFFIPGSTSGDVYALRFRRLTSATDQIRLDSLYIGPQSVVQGAAVTDWYSPTTDIVLKYGSTTATNVTSYSTKMKQIGDTLLLKSTIILSGAANAIGSMSVTLPNGLTIEGTKISGGSSYGYENSVLLFTNSKQFTGVIFLTSTTSTVGFQAADGGTSASGSGGSTDAVWAGNTTAGSNVPSGAALASGNFLTFTAHIPISTWSSNVTMANRAVEEYASNSNDTNADDTSAFAYGINGSLVPTIVSSAVTTSAAKTIRFTTPILATDSLFIEIQQAGTGSWIPLAGSNQYSVFVRQSNTIYGISVGPSTSTDAIVSFGWGGRNTNGASYAVAGASYPNNVADRWRVRKVSGGASVGYPIGARNVVGDTTGTAVPAGYVGEVITASLSNVSITPTTTAVTVGSLVLTAGTWIIYGKSMWTASGGASGTAYRVSISTTPATEHLPSAVIVYASPSPDFFVGSNPRVINTTGQTVHLVALGVYTGGANSTVATKSTFYAVRIA